MRAWGWLIEDSQPDKQGWQGTAVVDDRAGRRGRIVGLDGLLHCQLRQYYLCSSR